MRFVVNANSIDRLRISIGPITFGGADWPWVYGFDLSLTEDDKRKLDLGQMSMLGLLGTSWDELSGLTPDEAAVSLQPSCLAHDASELSQAMTSPGLHSPELQKMYHEAETLTANIPPAPPPTPVPTPTPPTTSDCTANGKTVTDPNHHVWSPTYFCDNVAGALVYSGPDFSAGSVGVMNTTHSWFACKTDSGARNGGSVHPSRWLWTQGDNDAWGWMSDRDVVSQTDSVPNCN